MQVLNIVPKNIHAILEFSSEEICDILDFIEKAIPLYAKVHLNGPIAKLAYTIEDFEKQLKSISKAIKAETE